MKRAKWSGQLAFILAAAASAIGLGNLWRFPYLAAQYGGGAFIAIYLILVVTLGFTLMLTEITIGRKTHQSQLTAFHRINKKWGFLGVLGTIIPLLIAPYYCVIGGWVMKYFASYAQMIFTGTQLMGEGAVNSGPFFQSFISSTFAPFSYTLVFILISFAVILLGVKHGIEKANLVMMPILFVMGFSLTIYIFSLPGAIDGVRYCLVPNLDGFREANGNFSFALLGKTILGAMGQMFYSLSLAMGIMITYGSYMRKEDSIENSVRRIELFDTAVSVFASLMIIPVVYIFAVKSGMPVKEAMNAGPGLMFITLPKVFATLGTFGTWAAVGFFMLVLFAAFTSSISILEACVAAVCDIFHIKRNKVIFGMMIFVTALASLSAFGYGPWAAVKIFGLQFLDFFDFITNSVLMPIVGALTCIFAGWVMKLKSITEEIELSGHPFRSRALYAVMVKWVAPMLIIAILISEICRAFGIGGWSI